MNAAAALAALSSVSPSFCRNFALDGTHMSPACGHGSRAPVPAPAFAAAATAGAAPGRCGGGGGGTHLDCQLDRPRVCVGHALVVRLRGAVPKGAPRAARQEPQQDHNEPHRVLHSIEVTGVAALFPYRAGAPVRVDEGAEGGKVATAGEEVVPLVAEVALREREDGTCARPGAGQEGGSPGARGARPTPRAVRGAARHRRGMGGLTELVEQRVDRFAGLRELQRGDRVQSPESAELFRQPLEQPGRLSGHPRGQEDANGLSR